MYFISVTGAFLLFLLSSFSADSLELESVPFPCDSTIYASSTAIGSVTTQLSKVENNQFTSPKVIKTKTFGYDATSFNHRDGHIYAISSYNPTGDLTPHLLKIDSKGEIHDLGGISELSGSDWIIGTFLADGTYVIGNFGFDWLRLDVETKKVLDRGTSEYFNPTTWATHPRENRIYGYQSAHQRLIVFDPAKDISFKMYGPQLTSIGVQSCSSVFTQNGQYKLLCKTSDIQTEEFYDIDLVGGVATKTGSYPAQSVGELATCAFSRPPVKPNMVIKLKTAHNN